MENDDQKITTNKLINSPNIALLLDQDELDEISQQVIHDYDIDKQSRSDWEVRNAEALKLALQVAEQKTTPWPDAANVMFPLVTIASLQCHAREYPALISGTELVKCRVIGDDPQGLKSARAKRVAAHMSYQLLEEDSNWEDQMDRVILTKAILGTAFKKVYFDPTTGHNVSEAVLAQDLVIPYKAKSLEKASRITHVMSLSKNDIYERVTRGIFLDVIDEQFQVAPSAGTPLQEVSDKIQGQHSVLGDSDEPLLLLEQHRYLDLDGDGYSEPYIVTVIPQLRKVVRIVARYFKDDIDYKGNRILRIRAQQFFVKYSMIPSPDGGIYDLGFGSLIGPLNHSVNTIINQLIDNGTLRNLGGGFLGRGAKLRRGQNQFQLGEWKQTDSTDLRNNIFPLPTNEPSQVLFSLLGMLVNYAERISGSTDIMSGQNVGQNTPAATAQELVKQGSVVFNSIFKRTYRSMKEEFRLLYRLNQLYLSSNRDFEELSTGDSAIILSVDYSGRETDIRPSADPNIASVEKRMQQAIFLKQASMQGPGYNHVAVEKRLLDAAQIPYISEVWNEKNPPIPNPKVQLEQMKLQFSQMKLKADMQYKMLQLMQEAEKIKAEVLELEARATKEMQEAQGVNVGHAIALMNAQIAERKNRQDGIIQSVKIIKDVLDSQQQQGGQGGVSGEGQQGGMGGMAAQPSQQGSPQIPQVPGV